MWTVWSVIFSATCHFLSAEVYNALNWIIICMALANPALGRTASACMWISFKLIKIMSSTVLIGLSVIDQDLKLVKNKTFYRGFYHVKWIKYV